ncbi:hypothetical protein JYK14_23535 [Siccirubricoccus sp. KC 17139]|uniref:Uncharacterized protein n=1 Tax=Siccirubricoccus soli TaxID=2899147 RepID=A0ABT1DAY9_9PROT|nr:hypothetical protein [Siccirubricoccus soli]MCO6419109.1 hypothetical protein [Siccirubricoccus soli]MCP2685244.1 hypothetical protein [Siccirubricoccus soli]
MPEDLLQSPDQPAAPEGSAPAPRPSEVPEKFRDPETGALRVDALLKSYRELERRLSQRMGMPGADVAPEDLLRFRQAMGIPESPEGYSITPPHELCCADAEVNGRLHRAHFTNDQAQLVYDLAAERLLPLIAEAAAQYEADRQREKLVEHFGGEERFRQVAAQLSAWARAKLPESVYGALASTAEGVLALEQMMRKAEPGLGRDAAPQTAESETELRAMMRDPRYWRQRDPVFVRRVTEGFRRLVGT